MDLVGGIWEAGLGPGVSGGRTRKVSEIPYCVHTTRWGTVIPLLTSQLLSRSAVGDERRRGPPSLGTSSLPTSIFASRLLDGRIAHKETICATIIHKHMNFTITATGTSSVPNVGCITRMLTSTQICSRAYRKSSWSIQVFEPKHSLSGINEHSLSDINGTTLVGSI